MFLGIDSCSLMTSFLDTKVPVGLLGFAKKISLVLLLIFERILSTLAVWFTSFATTPIAPAIEMAWGNCRNPNSVYIASSL